MAANIPAPLKPEEYISYLQGKLNIAETLLDKSSGLDERIDYTNILLTRLLENQGFSPTGSPVWITDLKASTDALAATVKALQAKLQSVPGLTLKNPKMIATKRTLVPVAGTATQLPNFVVPFDRYLTIKALGGNTDEVFIGNSKTESEDESFRYPMEPGEILQYKIRNTAQLWLDAAVSGEGIVWTVEQEEVVDNG